MRKIIIKAKTSDKAALLRKYETRDIAEDPIESFEVMIHDDAETLKELCSDPRIINWSDKDEKSQPVQKSELPKTEIPKIKEVAAVDLVKEGVRRNLKLLDTRDMKTLLARLMCLRSAIEWRAGSGMAPVTVVAESFGLPADSEPILEEETVKLMLRRMASCGKVDFDKKLLDSMIETTSEYFEHPEYLEYNSDFFLKKIFEYTWKETN
jgi:hypothetical protein